MPGHQGALYIIIGHFIFMDSRAPQKSHEEPQDKIIMGLGAWGSVEIDIFTHLFGRNSCSLTFYGTPVHYKYWDTMQPGPLKKFQSVTH